MPCPPQCGLLRYDSSATRIGDLSPQAPDGVGTQLPGQLERVLVLRSRFASLVPALTGAPGVSPGGGGAAAPDSQRIGVLVSSAAPPVDDAGSAAQRQRRTRIL